MSGYEVVLRRKACFMWFPIRFSTYEIVKKGEDLELIIKSGLISSSEEKIKLYRITDTVYERGFFNFFFGQANIRVISTDPSSSSKSRGVLVSKIHDARTFQKELEVLVESERKRMGITYKESNLVL